jgi:hypothetical protein
MKRPGAPEIVIIGTHSKDMDIIREYAGTGNDPLMHVTYGFGSFRGGIAHFARKNTKLPDALFIENRTCMDPKDLVNGSRELVKHIVKNMQPRAEPMLIIVEDPYGPEVAPIYEDVGLPVFCGPLFNAMYGKFEYAKVAPP